MVLGSVALAGVMVFTVFGSVCAQTLPNGEIRGQVLLVASIGEPEYEKGQGNNEQMDNGNQQHDNEDEGD
jgi:hypothetical protein